MIELKRNKEKLWITNRNRYEYIIFLVPFIGMFICIAFAIFQKRARIVLNHSLIYIFSVFGAGAIIYIMLLFGLESNFWIMSLFLLLVIMLWIVMPMILTYSLIFQTDSIYILEKFDQGYMSDRFKRDDIRKVNNRWFQLLYK